MNRPLNERRQFARIPFHGMATLRLSSGTREWPVTVLDLSFKGVLVDLPPEADATLGDTGTLCLRLGHTEEEIIMVIDVAHIHGPQAGLLCRSIDLDSVTHLRRLIAVNLGDPALLERDLKALIH